MNGADYTSASPFQPDPDHRSSTSNSGGDDIPIDPALSAIPVDPALLAEGERVSAEVGFLAILVLAADAVVHERVASRSRGRS